MTPFDFAINISATSLQRGSQLLKAVEDDTYPEVVFEFAALMMLMAKTRFSDSITCVVINLDSRPERWRRTRRLCRIQGFTPIRFAAHDKVRGVERFPDAKISPGNLGLWSSFLEVVTAEYDTGWLLVLEDDAIPLPRFRHHVMSEIRDADESVVSIRLGWLGRFAWLPNLDHRGNCVKFLRRAKGSLVRLVRRRPLDEVTLWGTHALLLRTDALLWIQESLLPVDTPLDKAFLRAERHYSNMFRLAHRNLAWQWPDRSDIQVLPPNTAQ